MNLILKIIVFVCLFCCYLQGQPRLIKDLYPGSGSSMILSKTETQLFAHKDKILMFANTPLTGLELHVFDPKDEKIGVLLDASSGIKSSKLYQFNSNGNILFYTCSNEVTGQELYTSNGTEAGTFLLKDLNTSGDGVSILQDYYATSPTGIYFRGKTKENGEELWFSDGTTSGTTLISDMIKGPSSSSPNNFFFHQKLNLLFFNGSNDNLISHPFISDGTSSGTIPLLKLGKLASSEPYGFTEFGNKVIFGASIDYDVFDQIQGLYISDGTPLGTKLIYSVTTKQTEAFGHLLSFGNLCIFSINGELFSTDGTLPGTKKLSTTLKLDDYSKMTIFNNKVLFTAFNNTTGYELYETDGTVANTKLFKDIVNGTFSSAPYNFVKVKNKLYFIISINFQDNQVWETDGTSGGTKQAFSLTTNGSKNYYSNLTALNNKLFFIGNDLVSGSELWTFDPDSVTQTKFVTNKAVISINPNPVGRNFYIKSDQSISHIELISLSGEIVKINFDKLNSKISVDNLPNSFYMIKVYFDNGGTISQKLIISNY